MIIKTKKKTISKSEIVFFDDINNHKNTKPDELTRSSGNIFERIFEREENIFGREYELFRVAGRTRLWLLFAMGFVLLM
ncbi:hypothetical protein D0502_02520 [Leuconostoc falkenbergense]|uniref:Uncharacterized protein n=1 Tax=Leuconostoc falkenbergense TaxID=2766470 RepID=A0A9X3INF7_9LACO|nr:hypothetical protein [Leuconostoc falkenbergense]